MPPATDTTDLDDGAGAGPTTLSGRPAVDAVAPRRTRVGWGARLGLGLLVVGALAGAGFVLFGGGPEGTDVRRMAVGQCYLETSVVQDHGRAVPYGRDTPCLQSTPRIVNVVPLPIGPFPGETGIREIVADRCGDETDILVAPNEASWVDGDRTLACIALP